ncbi:MAG: NADH-quinone oxidoreductase subunit C [Clostridia bacterium]
MESKMIACEEILKYAHEMQEQNYRLVQICATRIGPQIILDYSFGRGYEFVNLKCEIEQDTKVDSISHVYEPAFIYENEMHDLYGIDIRYMTTDYEGTFYRTAIKNPFYPLKKEGE